MIQLIDASEMKTSMKKNQGNKRFELSVDQRNWIIQTYIAGHDHGNSVLMPKETFMYRKVTTQRPLHAVIRFTEASVNEMLTCKPLAKLSDANKDALRSFLAQEYIATRSNQISYESADFVPCDMSVEIQAARPDLIELQLFPCAGHGLSYLVDPERYEQIIRGFCQRVLSSK